MRFQYMVGIAALCQNVFANAHRFPNYTLHERRTSVPISSSESVAPGLIVPVRVGLTQSNLEKGHDWLLEVSDPSSPKYGQYYTAEAVHQLFAPAESTISAVSGWLDAAGVRNVTLSANRQWLQFDASIAEVEQLLQTRYRYYDENTDTDIFELGCDEYSLPDSIRAHVDYITPAVKTMRLRKSHKGQSRSGNRTRSTDIKRAPTHQPLPMAMEDISRAAVADNLQFCSAVITPNCIAALYNISKPTGPVQAGNQLGIFEDVGQFVDTVDLDDFFAAVAPQIPNGTFPVFEGIDGAKNHSSLQYVSDETGGEAEIDFEVAYPIIYPQNPVVFQTDDDYYSFNYSQTRGGLFNTFLDGIDGSYCNYSAYGETGDSPIDPQYPDPHPGGYKGKLQCGIYKPTNVISLSYGIPESGGPPYGYNQRQCNEYMKLGMQGVSVVFSSGDSGVAEGFCLGANRTAFSPQFPASCPYVTSVGATVLPAGAQLPSNASAERAVQVFPSGGGFSNLFVRPSYQTDAVEKFFQSPAAPPYPYYTGTSMGNGLYNRSGRGYPDVSAVGDRILTFIGGDAVLSAGTSAAAPLFASILTRINEVRLAAGKPTVGFVNPMLYRNPQAFHDITVGNSSGCNTNGFNASAGWDPVTGLGSPNYPALLKVFMDV